MTPRASRTIPPVSIAAVFAIVAAALAGLACATAAGRQGTARATFAGGCFWCMEEPFEALPGVLSVTAGYAGGAAADPTHEKGAAGASDRAESVEIVYDPARITFERLLDVFWHNVDPLTADGQFCDRGREYRTAIFFHDEAQRAAAEESRRRVGETLHAPIVTEILPAGEFHRAEAFHQDFYKKNPIRYHEYKEGCGRERRLRELWGAAAGHGAEKP